MISMIMAGLLLYLGGISIGFGICYLFWVLPLSDDVSSLEQSTENMNNEIRRCMRENDRLVLKLIDMKGAANEP
jgi:hypothetical protein